MNDNYFTFARSYFGRNPMMGISPDTIIDESEADDRALRRLQFDGDDSVKRTLKNSTFCVFSSKFTKRILIKNG